MKSEGKQKIRELLRFIYPESYRPGDEESLFRIIDSFPALPPKEGLSEKDNVLIIYPDAIKKEGEPAIRTLCRFLHTYGEAVTNVHLLPFYPYSSDDGYAVTDYENVREDLGSWQDLEDLAGRRHLIFDFVVNHVSAKSQWFLRYLKGDPEFEDFFIEYREDFDVSKVVRPRTAPLFHEYPAAGGVKKLWTTFGEDQIDLNYGNFRVLIRMCGILAEYLRHGARCIRLDAVCYLWKESGKSCCNLPRTHAVIRLFRLLMDEIAPGAVLLTQTNVKHDENLSYFGDGSCEAGLVYQFALPPLVLNAVCSRRADKLTQWAKGINRISEKATFLNFLGGHDGIGLRPVADLLTGPERDRMIENTLAGGGRVSYSAGPDGKQEAYELNTNYLSALTSFGDSQEIQLKKTLAAHSVLFSVIGVPAVYYHGLLGSENDCRGMEESGIIRRINRQKFDEKELDDLMTGQPRRMIWNQLGEMLKIRGRNPAFSPYNPQTVMELDFRVFAVERYEYGKPGQRIISATNLSPEEVEISLPGRRDGKVLYNSFGEQKCREGKVLLAPYGFLWMEMGS